MGAKRPPLESGYYEVFNQDDVVLVDVRETPIERITPEGIKTTGGDYQFDVIIYATGFDAVTGALTRIDIRGEGGQRLSQHWANGPRTYLGLQTAGFPNFFFASHAAFCNYTVCAEILVEFIAGCVRHMRENGLVRIEPTPEAEQSWAEHLDACVAATVLNGTESWFMGSNIPGKKRAILLYTGDTAAYRKQCQDVVVNGYQGFVLR